MIIKKQSLTPDNYSRIALNMMHRYFCLNISRDIPPRHNLANLAYPTHSTGRRLVMRPFQIGTILRGEMKINIRKTTSVAAMSALTILGFSDTAGAGEYRWQSDFNNKYMNVNAASTADGGRVITSDSNAGNANQWWSDTYYSDGYFRITNMNSGKRLGRRDGTDATVSDGSWGYQAKCDVIQWSANDGDGQAWKYRSLFQKLANSDDPGRWVIVWINKYGCQGDPYWDALGTVSQNSKVYLYQEDSCNPGQWSLHAWCHWKRNGQYGQ